MKREVLRRKLKPKPGSQGKARKGIKGIVKLSAETLEDIDEILRSAAGVGPIERLNAIVECANNVLADLPAEDSTFMIFKDKHWEYLPDGYSIQDLDSIFRDFNGLQKVYRGLDQKSSLIEPASPEYFAFEARFQAKRALQMMSRSDITEAVQAAMSATLSLERARFAEVDEPLVAQALASGGGREGEREKYRENYIAAIMVVLRDPKYKYGTITRDYLFDEIVAQKIEVQDFKSPEIVIDNDNGKRKLAWKEDDGKDRDISVHLQQRLYRSKETT